MNAIQKVNGMLLNEKKVFVGRFVPRKEREKEPPINSQVGWCKFFPWEGDEHVDHMECDLQNSPGVETGGRASKIVCI